jgi:transcriptional regulator with XRE-family HTH domain
MNYQMAAKDSRLGESIRLARSACGLSVTALAEATGLPVRQIEGYESGRAPVEGDFLRRIAKILGIPAAALASGKVPGMPQTKQMVVVADPFDLEIIDGLRRMRQGTAKMAMLELIRSLAEPA